MTELKPCKDCGKMPRVRYRTPVWYVQCSSKTCKNRTGYYFDTYEQNDQKSKEMAIEAWNKEFGREG